MLEKALEYAKKGWPVFPCIGKVPLRGSHGVLDATTDPEKIKKLWALHPKANIALHVGAAGMMAIDLDPGYDMSDLERAVGPLPPTSLVQSTPSGGKHLFFQLAAGEKVPPSVGKLSKHVDVRSHNSSVLIYPSTTDKGAYYWESEGKAGFRSETLLRACQAKSFNPCREPSTPILCDLPENIDRAILWLKNVAQPAIEGEGGNAMTYATAAHLHSLAISYEKGLELITECYNPRCEPPWDYEALQRIVQNGYKYATSPPGNLVPRYHFDRVPLAEPKTSTKDFGRFRFTPRLELENIKKPAMIIPGFLPQEAYALLVGPTGSYKTFLALDIALSIAGGTDWPWGGLWPEIECPGPVLFMAGEGRSNIGLRVRAWENYHQKLPVTNFVLADPVPWVGESIHPVINGALALHAQYSLVVLDTVGRSMQGVNENAQEHASAFTRMAEALQHELGCTVLAIHHTGHESTGRARGSSVFGADADTIVCTEKLDKNCVCIAMTKQKDLDPWDRKRYVDMTPFGGSLIPVPGKNLSKIVLAQELVEEKLISVLDANPVKAWSNGALADYLATQPDMDITSQILRKKFLPSIAEGTTPASLCYCPDTRRWRFNRPTTAT